MGRGLYLGFGRGGELKGCAVLDGSEAGDRRVRGSMEVDDLVSIADDAGCLSDEIVVVKLEMSTGTRPWFPGSERFGVVNSEMDSEGIVMNAPPLAPNEGVVKAPGTISAIAYETKNTGQSAGGWETDLSPMSHHFALLASLAFHPRCREPRLHCGGTSRW